MPQAASSLCPSSILIFLSSFAGPKILQLPILSAYLSTGGGGSCCGKISLAHNSYLSSTEDSVPVKEIDNYRAQTLLCGIPVPSQA